MRKIDAKELERILREHRQWLDTEGEHGIRADLHGADLGGAKLFNADLTGADLGGANLRDADLTGADLGGAKLFNADLGGAKLFNADLTGADLGGAKLRDADLTGADLRGADLFNADLTGANLRGANLFNADLVDANLRGANLRGANLRGANVDGAYFEGAKILSTRVAKRDDLLDAKNIEGFEGFVFDKEDEERVKRESEERDKKAERELRPEKKETIFFSLPDSYSLSQIGRVLGLLGLLTEGVRLALTATFHSAEDLYRRVMQPELYEAQRDKYAAELVSIKKGSVEGQILVMGAVASTIVGIAGLWVRYTLGKDKLDITRQLAMQQSLDLTRRHALDVINSEHVSKELKEDAEKVIKDSWGKIGDISEQQNIAVTYVVGFVQQKWMLMKEKNGGQILIGKKPFGEDTDGEDTENQGR